MGSEKVVVVIPARYGSTRLPGKPLVSLAGQPMIRRVYDRAKSAKSVHEVIVARHMGIEVLGLSVVTNMAAGVLDKPIDHEEVMETGRRIEAEFTSLLTALVPQMDRAGS